MAGYSHSGFYASGQTRPTSQDFSLTRFDGGGEMIERLVSSGLSLKESQRIGRGVLAVAGDDRTLRRSRALELGKTFPPWGSDRAPSSKRSPIQSYGFEAMKRVVTCFYDSVAGNASLPVNIGVELGHIEGPGGLQPRSVLELEGDVEKAMVGVFEEGFGIPVVRPNSAWPSVKHELLQGGVYLKPQEWALKVRVNRPEWDAASGDVGVFEAFSRTTLAVVPRYDREQFDFRSSHTIDAIGRLAAKLSISTPTQIEEHDDVLVVPTTITCILHARTGCSATGRDVV